MKRVLVITYYWPPSGSVGTHRWLKMCKYLPQQGWQPVVYTPSDPEMPSVDEGLLRDVRPDLEVIKRPITEPFHLYKRFTGKPRDARLQTAFLREQGGGGWKEDLALWVRSNFFIPDARVWWVQPSIRHLTRYLRDHPVDVIVTTGSPHSLHLIGRALKRRLGIPWLADFRDPWTNIDFYGQLKLMRWADARHRALERAVLKEADGVLTVSWHWAEELRALGARDPQVITNGFDPADLPVPPAPVDERWSLVHVGSITATRDAPELWRALAARIARDVEFRERFVLRLVGGVDHRVLESMTRAGLLGHVERIGQVQHAEALREMQRARALLLPVNDTPNVMGFLPAKAFEYLSVGRPILAIAPRGADIERVCAGHTVVPRDDAQALQGAVDALFSAEAPVPAPPQEFTRQALTERLARTLDDLAATR